jgi:hypothetical protein
MANRFGRTQLQAGNKAARKPRLVILPKADKLWLLAGTAIITGAVMWPTHPALAACAEDPGVFITCQDVPAGNVETDPQNFTATTDGWQVDVGVNETVGTITVDDAGDEALDIDGDGFDGRIDITEGSTVEETSIDGFEAIDLDDVGVVTVNNAGIVQNDSSNSGFSAISASSFESFIVNNDGHIGSAGGSGISANDGGIVSITNTSQESVIGFFAGANVDFVDQFSYLNSGGITIGYDGTFNGQGIDFREVSGFADPLPLSQVLDDTPNTGLDETFFVDETHDDELSVLIVNLARVDETQGLLDGGMILGGEDGIFGEDIWTGDVLIANQGYWELEDTDGDGPGTTMALVFRDGGMIAGEDDDGIDINGAGESVFIYNNNTLDSVAARSLVGELQPDAVDFADDEVDDFFNDFFRDSLDTDTLPDDVPAGFTAGIWGDDNGINVDGEDGDDNVDDTQYVGIYNLNGLIGGRYGNGILITDIEGEDPVGGLEGNETSQAAGIWNGAGGMIWGEDEGVDFEFIDGSILIDNAGLPGSSLDGLTDLQMAALFGPEAAEDGFSFDGGRSPMSIAATSPSSTGSARQSAWERTV